MSTNQTIITALEPITSPIANVFNTIGLLLGGVVGIALISFFVRLYYMKKLQHKIDKIDRDLQDLKQKLNSKK